MIKLTDIQKTAADAWIHDIMVIAGIVSEPVRALSKDYYPCMYGTYAYLGYNAKSAAKQIANAIIVRPTDYRSIASLDQYLETLSNVKFIPDLKCADRHKRGSTRSAAELASYVAYFCAAHKLYWNSTSLSTYEFDEVHNHTILGKALFDGNCFTTQAEEKPAPATTTTRNTAPKDPNALPKNDFKSRGPLSGQAIGLVGNPGEKTTFSQDLYVIVGFDAAKKPLEQTAYIRPLDSKYADNGVNKMLFGSAKGYGFCQVYFTSQADAQRVANLICDDFNSKGIKPKEVDAIGVAKKKPMSNGYFQLSTKVGNVYISASKLNEDLIEQARRKAYMLGEAARPAEFNIYFTNQELYNRYFNSQE